MFSNQIVLYEWKDQTDYDLVKATMDDTSLSVTHDSLTNGLDKSPYECKKTLSVPVTEVFELCFILKVDCYDLLNLLQKRFNSSNAFNELISFLDKHGIGYERQERDNHNGVKVLAGANEKRELELVLSLLNGEPSDNGIFAAKVTARFVDQNLIVENVSDAKYWDTGILTNCTQIIVDGDALWKFADLAGANHRTDLLQFIASRFKGNSLEPLKKFLNSEKINYRIEER